MNVQSSYVGPEAADDGIRACIVESSCDPGNEIYEREIETENGIEKRNSKTDQGADRIYGIIDRLSVEI